MGKIIHRPMEAGIRGIVRQADIPDVHQCPAAMITGAARQRAAHTEPGAREIDRSHRRGECPGGIHRGPRERQAGKARTDQLPGDAGQNPQKAAAAGGEDGKRDGGIEVDGPEGAEGVHRRHDSQPIGHCRDEPPRISRRRSCHGQDGDHAERERAAEFGGKAFQVVHHACVRNEAGLSVTSPVGVKVGSGIARPTIGIGSLFPTGGVERLVDVGDFSGRCSGVAAPGCRLPGDTPQPGSGWACRRPSPPETIGMLRTRARSGESRPGPGA